MFELFVLATWFMFFRDQSVWLHRYGF